MFRKDIRRTILWEKQDLNNQLKNNARLLSLPDYQLESKNADFIIYPPCGANNHKWTLIYKKKDSFSFNSLIEAKGKAEEIKSK